MAAVPLPALLLVPAPPLLLLPEAPVLAAPACCPCRGELTHAADLVGVGHTALPSTVTAWEAAPAPARCMGVAAPMTVHSGLAHCTRCTALCTLLHCDTGAARLAAGSPVLGWACALPTRLLSMSHCCWLNRSALPVTDSCCTASAPMHWGATLDAVHDVAVGATQGASSHEVSSTSPASLRASNWEV